MRNNINPELAHQMQKLYLNLMIVKELEERGSQEAFKFRNEVSEDYKSIIDLTPNTSDSSLIHECQYYSNESGYPNTFYARYFILGGDSIRIIDSSYGG